MAQLNTQLEALAQGELPTEEAMTAPTQALPLLILSITHKLGLLFNKIPSVGHIL
jgi:hypothetical protein